MSDSCVQSTDGYGIKITIFVEKEIEILITALHGRYLEILPFQFFNWLALGGISQHDQVPTDHHGSG